MATPASEIVAALQSFGDDADDLIISALRTLAFVGTGDSR